MTGRAAVVGRALGTGGRSSAGGEPARPHSRRRIGERASGSVRTPRTGEVLHLTRTASVQFFRPIFVRVIRVLDWPTYDGWLWIDAYELAANGDAVARRSLFVMPAGLIWPDPPAPRSTTRRPVKRPPVRVG